jgi:hypothetical protein
MTRRGLGDRMILHAVREERAVPTQSSQAAGQLRSKPVEVVGNHLVDDQQHDQRRRLAASTLCLRHRRCRSGQR